MEESERFRALKEQAWNDRDLELFEFYNRIEYELKRLRTVGRAVSSMYEKGGNDDTWNFLFEALFDAGLLQDTDSDDYRDES